MSWTTNDQAQLDLLRRKELAGTLSEPERQELAGLMARVEAEEAAALAPAMSRLRAEVEARDAQLQALEEGNEELSRLRAQQQ